MLLPLGFPVVSPLPGLPRPARAGAKGDGGRSAAAGTALEMVLPELQGRGSKTVLVSLRRFRETRMLEKGQRKARERGHMKIILLPDNIRTAGVGVGGGGTYILVFELCDQVGSYPTLGFLDCTRLKVEVSTP